MAGAHVRQQLGANLAPGAHAELLEALHGSGVGALSGALLQRRRKGAAQRRARAFARRRAGARLIQLVALSVTPLLLSHVHHLLGLEEVLEASGALALSLAVLRSQARACLMEPSAFTAPFGDNSRRIRLAQARRSSDPPAAAAAAMAAAVLGSVQPAQEDAAAAQNERLAARARSGLGRGARQLLES